MEGWEMEQVFQPIDSKGDKTEEVDRIHILLDNGWEPFAVVDFLSNGNSIGCIIFFKRKLTD